MKLLTFQSDNVLSLILSGKYYADTKYSREQRDYSKDVEMLGGYDPIWCMSLSNQQDLANGTTFQRCRCEMSLNKSRGLSEFILLELSVESSRIHNGITHNASNFVKVIPFVIKSDLCAVYRLNYDLHWYLPRVHVIAKYCDNVLFAEDFLCRDIESDSDAKGYRVMCGSRYYAGGMEFVDNEVKSKLFVTATEAEETCNKLHAEGNHNVCMVELGVKSWIEKDTVLFE